MTRTTGVFGRMRRLVPLMLLLALGIAAPGSSGVGGSVVELPVSFAVVNTNTTQTAAACTPDGKAYTVRGTIAAPQGALADGTADSVTLHLHGSGDGSTWNFTAVPGVNHIAEMATLGHVSVFIHNLGYGTSDPIDGFDLCYGSFADMAHQVVQHLRAGTYTLDGAQAPAFERVSLIGHSGGAVAAELYAISYDDIDAVGIAGWADIAPSFVPLYTKASRFAAACARGGRSKTPGGPAGWARIFDTADLDRLLYNVDPEVKAAFAALYEDDPCGIIDDVGLLLSSSVALSPVVVQIPVLLIYGDHDPFLPLAFEIEATRYLSSDDVTLEVVPNSGHNAMHGNTAAEYRAVLSGWLKARGF